MNPTNHEFPRTLTHSHTDAWGYAHYEDEHGNEYAFALEELTPVQDDEQAPTTTQDTTTVNP